MPQYKILDWKTKLEHIQNLTNKSNEQMADVLGITVSQYEKHLKRKSNPNSQVTFRLGLLYAEILSGMIFLNQFLKVPKEINPLDDDY